jgi:hypothetical protein
MSAPKLSKSASRASVSGTGSAPAEFSVLDEIPVELPKQTVLAKSASRAPAKAVGAALDGAVDGVAELLAPVVAVAVETLPLERLAAARFGDAPASTTVVVMV